MDTKTLKDIIATRIQAENGNPTGRKCLQENSRHYKLHGRGRQRPHEGNGAGELPAHQGRGEADCAGGTGAYQKRSGAV